MKSGLTIPVLSLFALVAFIQVALAANSDDEIEAGRLKADQVCANCHGLYGEAASGGNSAMSPKLTAQRREYLVSRLRDYRSGIIEHPQMSLIARMINEQDIDNVASWYASIPIDISVSEAGTGKQQATRFCAGCHGLDGQAVEGGGFASIPNLSAQPRVYLVDRLRQYRSGKLVSPFMSPVAGGLTDSDIENVADWYSSIEVNLLESN